MKERILDKNVIEFVAVGVEYCHLIESYFSVEKRAFALTLTRLLPLLYLKATLLPTAESDAMHPLEQFVTEENYEQIRLGIADLMENDDVFLDTFVEEMKYSETPIACYISEGLADTYQDIKNFTERYRLGSQDVMYEALVTLAENFKNYWGQTVLNTLKALHGVAYVDQENNPENELYD